MIIIQIGCMEMCASAVATDAAYSAVFSKISLSLFPLLIMESQSGTM